MYIAISDVVQHYVYIYDYWWCIGWLGTSSALHVFNLLANCIIIGFTFLKRAPHNRLHALPIQLIHICIIIAHRAIESNAGSLRREGPPLGRGLVILTAHSALNDDDELISLTLTALHYWQLNRSKNRKEVTASVDCDNDNKLVLFSRSIKWVDNWWQKALILSHKSINLCIINTHTCTYKLHVLISQWEFSFSPFCMHIYIICWYMTQHRTLQLYRRLP